MHKYTYISILIFFIHLLNTNGVYSQDKNTIAVLPLQGTGITESEIIVLTDQLRTVLVETQKFNVLERSNMEAILSEQGFQMSGCVSTECAVEAGKLLGVAKMLTGSIGKIGELYNITLRIFDVQTSKIEKTVSERHDGAVEKLLDVVTQAVYQLTDTQDSAKMRMTSRPEEANRLAIFAGITSMKTTLHQAADMGFAGGISYQVYKINSIAFVPELLFAAREFDYYQSEEFISFENLQLAFLLAYQWPLSNAYVINFEAGPSAAYILKGTKRAYGETFDLFNYDNGSVINTTEFSIVFGTSFGFFIDKTLLFLKARYELGLTDIFKNEESWEAGKSRVLFIMLGVAI